MATSFEAKLIEVIAAKVITEYDLSKIQLPAPFGHLRWTGWKDHFSYIEKHAQLLWFMEKGSRYCYYVDIPSMRHGKIENGQSFSIDWIKDVSHHMDPNTTIDEMRTWFVEGMNLLFSDVMADNPWMFDTPFKEKQ